MESFAKLLFDKKPSIMILQDTKKKTTRSKNKGKTNFANYKFLSYLEKKKSLEKGGKGLNGGSLSIGALHDLNPVFLRQVDGQVECITIEVTIGLTILRCMVGYGPPVMGQH